MEELASSNLKREGEASEGRDEWANKSTIQQHVQKRARANTQESSVAQTRVEVQAQVRVINQWVHRLAQEIEDDADGMVMKVAITQEGTRIPLGPLLEELRRLHANELGGGAASGCWDASPGCGDMWLALANAPIGTLVLSHNELAGMPQHAWELLLGAIERNPRITALDLAHNALARLPAGTWEVLWAVLRRCENVRELRLSNNLLAELGTGGGELGGSTSSKEEGPAAWRSLARCIREHGSLTELSLGGNDLHRSAPGAFALLLGAIRAAPRLRVLRLNRNGLCGLSPELWTQLTATIGQSRSLRIVKLHDNQLSELSLHAWVELARAAACPDGERGAGRSGSGNAALETLDLFDNELGAEWRGRNVQEGRLLDGIKHELWAARSTGRAAFIRECGRAESGALEWSERGLGALLDAGIAKKCDGCPGCGCAADGLRLLAGMLVKDIDAHCQQLSEQSAHGSTSSQGTHSKEEKHEKSLFFLIQLLCACFALGTYFESGERPSARPSASNSDQVFCYVAHGALVIFYKPLVPALWYCLLTMAEGGSLLPHNAMTEALCFITQLLFVTWSAMCFVFTVPLVFGAFFYLGILFMLCFIVLNGVDTQRSGSLRGMAATSEVWISISIRQGVRIRGLLDWYFTRGGENLWEIASKRDSPGLYHKHDHDGGDVVTRHVWLGLTKRGPRQVGAEDWEALDIEIRRELLFVKKWFGVRTLFYSWFVTMIFGMRLWPYYQGRGYFTVLEDTAADLGVAFLVLPKLVLLDLMPLWQAFKGLFSVDFFQFL
eukprot:g1367.t1